MLDFDELQQDKIHDECGVFGIISEKTEENKAFDVYNALFALQHRGQHSAGIAVSDGKNIKYRKADGLVPEVFDDKTLEKLSGSIAMGHVRYASQSGMSGINAHPIVIKHSCGQLAVALNGSLVNERQLRAEAESHGGVFQTNNDAEIIVHLLVREMLNEKNIEAAAMSIMHQIVGAYCILIMTEDKMIALRDPHGFRPLCIGKVDNDIVFASESCALDAVGATFLRDVEPGEIIIAEKGRISSLASGIKAKESVCAFEFVYFARPDSCIDGYSVELARQEAGRCIAKADNIKADVVIGVPDSGLSSALGYSYQSGIPYANGFVKNRYIGRTFIQATQAQRERAVKLKLNAVSAVVAGKSVVMIDDSIVRGTTCARIVNILRDAGAKEVHMRVASPPFLHPCYFGTDIPNRDVLIAHSHTVEEIRQIIGVDTLRYLSIEDVDYIAKGLRWGICKGCFTGEYSVPVPENKE